MNTVSVPADLFQQVVAYINVTSQFAKRAMDERSVHLQTQKRAADLHAPLLDHLVKQGMVADHQRAAAAAMLGSHDTTLNLLKLAVDRVVEYKEKLAKHGIKLGEAEDDPTVPVRRGTEKKASDGGYNSLTDPIVGRRTSFVKESDKALMRGVVPIQG